MKFYTTFSHRVLGLIITTLLFTSFSYAAVRLDQTFGSGGIVNTHLIEAASLYDMAIQPNGKIIVVGTTFDPMRITTVGMIARFNSNGTLDLTYDTDGYNNTTPFREIQIIKMMPNGKYILGGSLWTGSGFAMAKFNEDGSADGNFGIVQTTIGLSSVISSINILPDGKILAVGSTRLMSNSTFDYAMVKYNADGTLDTTFGTGGRVAADFGTEEFGYDASIQSDGKIIIAGDFTDVLANKKLAAVARFNPNGSLDTSFGTNGKVLKSAAVDIRANRLAIQPDNKIIITGPNYSPVRYNADGTLDSSFNTQLFVSNLSIQPDGKIIFGGQGFLFRSNSDGTPDFSFGPNGIVSASFLYVTTIITSNGKILIGGTRLNNNFEMQLARYSVNSVSDFDFDGDGKADVSVYRASTNTWYRILSGNSSVSQNNFGIANDIPVPADFDGDGKTDLAIFRPSTGTFWYQSSINNAQIATQWGQSGDIPRPSDFDGDGKADFITFRPSENNWYRLGSTGQVSNSSFGVVGDKPVTGDFDGDGRSDVAIFRPSTGDWWYQSSITNAQRATHFGASTDIPAPADFDGDGKTDFAVYRPSTGVWYILNSSTGVATIVQFGIAEDKPVPADYDGDGKPDIAVFRPSTGLWYLLRSTSGFSALQFGISSDVALPNSFIQ